MDLLKPLLITIVVFLLIGFGFGKYNEIENCKKADGIIASAKDLYKQKHYSRALAKVNKCSCSKNKEDYLNVKYKCLALD